MKIGFWGNFGTQNFGNECTLAAILGNFRLRLPEAELLVIGVVPEDVRTRHQVGALPIWNQPPVLRESGRRPKLMRLIQRSFGQIAEWHRAFKQTRGLDALIVPGTGILNDHYEGVFGLPYHLFKWVVATRLRGGRVLFVSVGAETVSRPLSRFFIRSALRLADYRSFRDTHALKLVRAIGFTGLSQVYPDLAFSLPKVSSPEPAPKSSSLTVALGLYNYRNRGRDNAAAMRAYDGYLEKICALVLWLTKHGHRVRIIIGDMSYDMDILADVRSRLKLRGFDLKNPGYADTPARSYEEVMDQLRTVDLVIASRFHNILLALFLGCPVLSLSYEGKIEALMQDMGLEDYCQTLESFDVTGLVGLLPQISGRMAALNAAIRDRAQVNRQKLDMQYDLILSRLGRSMPISRQVTQPS